jgi:CubicO group peptidase (beta-lactamase class C family)
VAKSWNRPEIWIAVIVLPIGLLIVFVLGLWAFVGATTKPIHPNAQEAPSVASAAPAPAWTAAVEESRRTVRAFLTEQNPPGLSVAVGIGGEIVWAEGFGWRDIENRVKVTPDTRFRIGTASAMLTSAAVGLLMEQKRLNLDEEIQTYVPEFPKKQWPVRLRQLMGHVAGIVPDEGDEEPQAGALLENARRAAALCERVADVRARDGVSLFELRLGSRERGGRSRDP